MRIELIDDQMCFACGAKNETGLKLTFDVDAKNSLIRTRFAFQKVHQGFANIVHGGLIALVLDEVMVNLLFKMGKRAVTGRIAVRFFNPCTVGELVEFEGRMIKEMHNLIYTEAAARGGDNRLIAQAKATCIKV